MLDIQKPPKQGLLLDHVVSAAEDSVDLNGGDLRAKVRLISLSDMKLWLHQD